MKKKAVGLHYEEDLSAPEVLFKAEGVDAEEIIRLAMEKGIPLHHNPTLIDELMRLEPMQEIPSDLYELVAEILLFAYEILGKHPFHDAP